MKILFVESHLHVSPWGFHYSPGVASMSAVVKKAGYKADLFIVDNKDDIERLLLQIGIDKPDIIGFGLTESSFLGVKEIVSIIKKNYPDIFIICGGIFAVLNPQDVVKFIKCDAVCVGEGEYPLLELMNSFHNGKVGTSHINNIWFKKGNRVIKNPLNFPIDLNKLPRPDRGMFFKKNADIYNGPFYLKDGLKGGVFVFSRGCVFHCSYCSNWLLNKRYKGKYYRLMDPKKLIRELVWAQKRYKYDYIIFADAFLPTHNKRWFNEFAKLYKKNIKIPFCAQLKIGMFDQEDVKKLKDANCYYAEIGLESGDEEIRTMILDKKDTDKEIEDGIKLLNKAGIKVGLFNMIGTPGETSKTILKTIAFNGRLHVDISNVFIFYPYKGTKLYEVCYRSGLINKTMLGNIGKSFKDREDSCLDLESLRREDILYYYDNFQLLVNIYKTAFVRNKIIYRFLYALLTGLPLSRNIFLKLYKDLYLKLF
jgi:anaerobic magnesium-protoporphyrin IX monomethyl ester cyclase